MHKPYICKDWTREEKCLEIAGYYINDFAYWCNHHRLKRVATMLYRLCWAIEKRILAL